MIYVGDNPNKDFYIGKLFPIRTVRIVRDRSIYDGSNYYKNIVPNYIAKSLGEVLKIIANINNEGVS